MNKKQRVHIFTRLSAQHPEPTTELDYQNTFQLLIAVILSAQATDVSVNRATSTLFALAGTPEEMLALGLKGLKKYIKTIGLYNTKAANIINTCQHLIDEHNSEVPGDRESLERLPGVGRKTANVILNTAFGLPVIAVDTHIFRLANRTGLAPGKNVREVEERLMQSVPDEFKQHAHHWLILHGRYTCLARKPKCGACCIYQYCEWPDKKDSR